MEQVHRHLNVPIPFAGERRDSRIAAIVLVSPILVLALFLRIYLLEDKAVWWDEAISAWTARKSPLDIILYQAGSVHPPLHYLVLHYWGLVAGESEFALRYLSALFGVASVAVLYRLGREFFGQFAAVSVALLLAVSRFHVWWSQEIRMYSLAVLLGIVSLYLLLLALRDDKWSYWVLYSVTTIAALYTLYLNALTVVAQNVLAVALAVAPLAGRRKSIRWLVKWAAVQAIILLAYSPWLYLLVTHASSRPSSDIPTLGFALFWQVYATAISLGVDINIGDYAYLLPLPLLLAALGILGAILDRQRRHLGLMLLLYLTIAPALIYALSLPTSVFYTPLVHSRYFLYLVPAFLLAVVWGVALVWRKLAPLGFALLATLAAITFYFTTGYYSDRFMQDDYHAMAATIDAYAEPSDAIVLYPDTDWPIFLYHYKGSLPHYDIGQAIDMTPEWVDDTLSPVLKEHQRLWLVSSVKSLDSDPERYVLAWLSANAQPVLDQEYSETRLTLYERPGRSQQSVRLLKPNPVHPLDEARVGGIDLIGFDQWLSRAPSGGTVHLSLYWRPQDSARYDYSLAMVDAAGTAICDQPVHLEGYVEGQGPLRSENAIVIPASAPGGNYHWQLRATERGSNAFSGSFDFGRIEVVGMSNSLAAPQNPGGPTEIEHRREVTLGDDVLLLGYDLQPATGEVLKQGDVVHLTLYWQRQRQITTSYTVFVHLLGETTNPVRKNLIWGQKDSIPVDGQAPTTGWGPNDIIVDRYEIQLDNDAPPGHYTLETGMYQRATGQRIEAFEGGEQIGDRVVVGEYDVQ